MTRSMTFEQTAGAARRPAPSTVAAVALVAALAFAPASRAQLPPSDKDQATAAALFKEARPLLVKGDYAAACPKLAASLDLFATASIRLNVAKCHEHDGKFAAALLDYQVALVLNKGTKGAARRQALEKIAQDGLAALEPRLPRLRIVIAEPPPGLRVTRDGQELPLATLGDAMPVDPGPHDAEATAPGFERVKQTVTMVEGTTTDVSLLLTRAPTLPVATEPATPAPLPPAPADARRASFGARRIAGLVFIGTGVAGVVIGAVAGSLAIAQHRSLAMSCSAGVCPDHSYDAAVDAYHAKGLISTAGFVVGAAALGGGVVILATAPRARAVSGLRFTPRVGLGTIIAEGSF